MIIAHSAIPRQYVPFVRYKTSPNNSRCKRTFNGITRCFSAHEFLIFISICAC